MNGLFNAVLQASAHENRHEDQQRFQLCMAAICRR